MIEVIGLLWHRILWPVFLALYFYSYNANSYVDFYANCVKSYNYSNDITDAIVLTPLNYICYERCQSECNAFSRVFNNIELNNDVIQSCITPCQSGILYSSMVKVDPNTTAGPYAIGSSCTANDDALDLSLNAYKTRFIVKNGDVFNISLSSSPIAENKISMCGRKSIELKPLFPNTNDIKASMNQDWYNGTTPPASWSNQSDNQCFAQYTDWSLRNDPNVWNDFRRQDAGICGWHVKNPFFTDTGLFVSDGDELTISWQGDYSYKNYDGFIKDTNGNTTSYSQIMNQNELISCINNTNFSTESKNQCKEILKNTTTILIKSPDANPISLIGEMSRPNQQVGNIVNLCTTDPDACKESNSYSTNGLIGKVIESNIKLGIAGTCDSNSPASYSDPNCMVYYDYGIRSYLFSGILSNFSSSKTNLLLKHYSDSLATDNVQNKCVIEKKEHIPTIPHKQYPKDPIQYLFQKAKIDQENKEIDKKNDDIYRQNQEIDQENALIDQQNNSGLCPVDQIRSNVEETGYGSMNGGYTVNLDWLGCPFNDGKRVQYAIVPDESEDQKTFTWQDLDPQIFIDSEFIIKTNQEGRLYLRIKPMDSSELPPSAQEQDAHSQYANYSGQYYIMLTKIETSSLSVINGTLQKLAVALDKAMFGSNYKIGQLPTSGAVYKVYTQIMSNNNYMTIIKVFLVMYVSFIGLCYIIGITEIYQKQFVYMLIKIGCILTVISPAGWSFYASYLIPFFHDGLSDLIKLMVPTEVIHESGLSAEEFQKENYSILAVLDGPLKVILSSATWSKVAGLIFSGLLGIIVALVLVVACAFYLFGIVKATVVYLASFLVISILLTLLPLVIPFALFKMTNHIFDGWIKVFIASFLQPIFVMSTMLTFNMALYMLLIMSLSFTVCPSCFCSFEFFNKVYCAIPSYSMLSGQHYPPDNLLAFSVSQGVFPCSIALLILSLGYAQFSSTMAKLAIAISGSSNADLILSSLNTTVSSGNRLKALAYSNWKK